MVASGPPATINYELRQARKGATVVVDLCAGVWLEVPPPPLVLCYSTLFYFIRVYLSILSVFNL